jgi:hypothetical protein
MSNEELKKYQEDTAKLMRIRQQAYALLNRAKNADIPESEMRIKEEELRKLINDDYYKRSLSNRLNSKEEVDRFIKEIYTVPDKILKTPFIIIDGGNMYTRKRAGFALLFRGITWDRTGMHIGCAKATHSLHSIKTIGNVTRNEYADELKSYDILFLSECFKELFKPSFETGSFFDEILENREINGKTTIISFVKPIPAKGIDSQERLSDIGSGQYMMMFTESDSDDSYKNLMRINIK